ncbi:hypothetical protein DPX16_21519 [Anabarilius grahami]|uniref:Uncharacterized protein n=1 Tax=Anabarilius grahami TaxID=495550 RepID=A0A3N0XVY7_ANAGA|nr:hypothetical protein DPX16_21519 [Anabarilius grahami]
MNRCSASTVCSGPEIREHRADHMRESAQTIKAEAQWRLDLLDRDVLSFELSDTADSMLLAPSSQKQVETVKEGQYIACIEPSRPASPAYEEEFMAHATSRFLSGVGAR